ncbi:hypothetical protein JAAARDRAFT_640264 [Jaapia argillacea MUCL 33604]|uniref:Uncharacterized protein n=1 Tax=Jaapia argillacea MUCL 33604 TaxID=933084 RepID=A0A067PGE0_9AGAM|nr:hypothetical protein JAAARDRAFT_640264 [Jaapia argillacea MUCL 33604]
MAQDHLAKDVDLSQYENGMVFVGDDVWDLRRIVTNSTNSTISNLPGPGRTLDNIISRLGRSLERKLSFWAERLGYGPNAAAIRILRILKRLKMCPCRREKELKTSLPQAAAFEAILLDLLSTILNESPDGYFVDDGQGSKKCVRCGGDRGPDGFPSLQDRRDVQRNCKQMLTFISQGKTPTKVTAIKYVTVLTSSHPIFHEIFTSTGAITILESILSDSTRYFPASDPLLFSARRALISLGVTKVMSLAKDILLQSHFIDQNADKFEYRGGYCHLRIVRSKGSERTNASSAWDALTADSRYLMSLLR